MVSRAHVFVPLLAIASVASCGDPVHDREVDALGPEAPGVRAGPLHRGGQPCVVCHGSDGPANPEMSIAGTVYQVYNQPDPLSGGVVTLTDAAGASRAVHTNSAGNFWILASTWKPVYPVTVTLDYNGVSTKMVSRIGRAASCADCHRSPEGPSAPAPVYLVTDPSLFPGGG